MAPPPERSIEPRARALAVLLPLLFLGSAGGTSVPGSRGGPVAVPASGPAHGLQEGGYGPLGPVLETLGIPAAHALGFRGTGIRIGVLGGHFRLDHPLLSGLDVVGTRDFVDGDDDVTPPAGAPSGAGARGTALLSLLAADRPETLGGASSDASFLLARTLAEEGSPAADQDRSVEALEWLVTGGARIVLSATAFRDFDDGSIPFQDLDGATTPATLAALEAARRGVLVVTPMGDRGPQPRTLGAPADADSVLAVGALDAAGDTADFSARGPTADGRPKPDAAAPGTDVPAAASDGPIELVAVSGTDVAATLAAGAAALVADAHPDLGPAELVAALARTAEVRPPGQIPAPHAAAAALFPMGVRALPLEEVSPGGRVLDLVPTFRWDVPRAHPLALPVTFRLQIAPEPDFATILLADTTVGTFATRLPAPLPPRRPFHWRVEAESPDGVVTWSRSMGPFEVPAWVELLVLDDPRGATVDDPTPTFVWESLPVAPPAGPLVFDLEILSDREEEPLAVFADLGVESFEVPDALPFNTPLRWRIVARSPGGIADTATSAGPFVVTSRARPPTTVLFQNFPNPFPREDLGLEETRVWFDLSETGPVRLGVFDLRGRLVRSLIPAAAGCGAVVLEAGSYGRDDSPPVDPTCVRLRWDGRNERGEVVEPAVYLLRLGSPGGERVRRMVWWP